MNEYIFALIDGTEIIICGANSTAASISFEEEYPELVQDVVKIYRNID